MTDTLLQTIINTPTGSAASGLTAAAAVDIPNTGHSTIDLVLKVVIAITGLIPAIKQLFVKRNVNKILKLKKSRHEKNNVLGNRWNCRTGWNLVFFWLEN